MRDCLKSVTNISKIILTATLAINLALINTQSLAATSTNTGTDIRGNIGDGPVIGAKISLYNRNGVYISNQRKDALANYHIRTYTRPAYPVQIFATRGRDLVTGKPLDYAVASTSLAPTQSRANLNIYSTFIVSMARNMKYGLTPSNVSKATRILVREFNFGLQTNLVPDPMRTPITARNIATTVRSSEALAEVVRRTRKSLSHASYWRTNNYVINALAADLIDGRLDGRGAARTDSRVSATANIVSAQVLVESLQNRLYINGTLAKPAMDRAIRTVQPTASVLTDSVAISQAMLTQTKRMLSAARKFDSRPQLIQLATIVNKLKAGSSPARARALLDDYHARLLNTTVNQIAQAPRTKQLQVNNVVRAGSITPIPSAKPLLSISGTPAANIAAGSSYSFAPSTVAKGTKRISYTIANKPKWAGFNSTNGRLSGTPSAANVGTYKNIVIRASDGKLSAALKAFSIRVGGTQVSTTTNRTIKWVAPRTRADGSSISLSEIAGYRIRYGTAPGRYTNTVVVNNGSTSYKLPKLKTGTYYFVVTTLDRAGLESKYSPTASAKL